MKRLSVKQIIVDLHASADRLVREHDRLFNAGKRDESLEPLRAASECRRHADAYAKGRLINEDPNGV